MHRPARDRASQDIELVEVDRFRQREWTRMLGELGGLFLHPGAVEHFRVLTALAGRMDGAENNSEIKSAI